MTFVAVSLALMMKPKRLGKLIAEMENEATMFFWGVVSLVIGIAMVLAHNVWAWDWRVVVTILGWLTLAKGLDVLLLPDKMKKRWAKTGNQKWSMLLVTLLLFGLVLACLGFTA